MLGFTVISPTFRTTLVTLRSIGGLPRIMNSVLQSFKDGKDDEKQSFIPLIQFSIFSIAANKPEVVVVSISLRSSA
jgi:hypothetical protein